MDKDNMSTSLENTSAASINTSQSAGISSVNAVCSTLLLLSFLVGAAMNGFCLWVLGVKMKKTVYALWFFHLVLSYLMVCAFLPFYAIYALLGFHWIFGTVFCKLSTFIFSLWMFIAAFLLTIISLDRCLIIGNPTWTQNHRSIPWAKKLIAWTWLASVALSVAYPVFQETLVVEKDRIVCKNHCAISIQVVLFLFQFLVAFLLPFIIIVGSYCWVGQKMKKKRLVKTGKTYRVLVASVGSFFICWFPFHLHNGLLLMEVPEIIVQFLWHMMLIGGCLNTCFTPILYLFVGEEFQVIFRMSIPTLLKKAFVDASEEDGNNEEEDHRINNPRSSGRR
ncbi:putative G-protein coupled receptor 33 [Varanus komodoensis]|nr:putative G-protein coupled receptor 33 [Varanus komodoensis]